MAAIDPAITNDDAINKIICRLLSATDIVGSSDSINPARIGRVNVRNARDAERVESFRVAVEEDDVRAGPLHVAGGDPLVIPIAHLPAVEDGGHPGPGLVQ